MQISHINQKKVLNDLPGIRKNKKCLAVPNSCCRTRLKYHASIAYRTVSTIIIFKQLAKEYPPLETLLHCTPISIVIKKGDQKE